MKKGIIWLIVIALVVGGGYLLIKKNSAKKPKGHRGGFKGKSTHIVAKGEITVKLEETGEIQPIREIKIKTEIGGKVVKLHALEGDYITKGQIIAEVEPDYEQSATIANKKSSFKRAEITLKNAKRDYDNNTKLLAQNYISQVELDKNKDAVEQAELNFEIASQQYDLVKDLSIDGNISRIKSSASGTVIQKHVEEGEMVRSNVGSYSEGTTLLTLADLNQMVVNTTINEVDISKIQKGQKVAIQVDAYPYEKFRGKITSIAAKAINQSNVKVFPVEIRILDSDKRLKPGMTANTTIIGETRDEIVVVPIRAIFADSKGNDIVYQVVNDSTKTAKVVKTGINNLQQVEIIKGIDVGDTISFAEPKKREPNSHIKTR